MIERNENIEDTQRNKKSIEQNMELYKRRQEIVEHPFGTIKRQWGFDYTLMKGKKKVDGEVGLIFIAYLLTRLMNISGLSGLKNSIYHLIGRFIRSISHLNQDMFENQNMRRFYGQKIHSCRFSQIIM